MTVEEALAAAESWVPIPDPAECAHLLAHEVRLLRVELAEERARRAGVTAAWLLACGRTGAPPLARGFGGQPGAG